MVSFLPLNFEVLITSIKIELSVSNVTRLSYAINIYNIVKYKLKIYTYNSFTWAQYSVVNYF